MNLWLALVTLAACAAAFLAVPFLRARGQTASQATETDIYKQQLRNLAEEISAGDVDEATAAEERIAIERRILAETPKLPEAVATAQTDRVTAIGVAAIVVLGAVGLYSAIGEPAVPSSQHAAPAASGVTAAASSPVQAAQRQLPDVDTMIARLADRLKANPNDPDGWRMLGWSYFQTQRYAQSVDAYAHAVALKPESAELQSAYGEAQTLAAGGQITAGAEVALKRALAANPNDERAHFYSGLLKKQKGNVQGAIAEWIAALRNARPDSIWTPRLRTQIEEQARASGIDVSGKLPPAPPSQPSTFAQPTAQDIQQAQAMSPEERQAMINNMVEGLDRRLRKNPADPEGWVRLIRSRMVMGRADLARDALTRAIAAFTNDKSTREKIIAAAAGLGVRLER